jgi:basic membrane lipoprotein Med (substrate-binding protein (PBP1-ABC) superfamily)
VISYVGNWDDVSAGREQALAQVSRGIDVIFQNADAAGLGVFQAARERGIWVIGANADQNSIAPEVTLGSVLIDLPLAFLTVTREVAAGTFKPRVIALGTSSGVVRLLLNPVVRGRIPAPVLAEVDSVSRGLEIGALSIPVASRDATSR